VAEIVPPQAGRSPLLADERLAEAVHEGWLAPPLLTVIYPDSSVALAHLLAADHPAEVEPLIVGPGSNVYNIMLRYTRHTAYAPCAPISKSMMSS
jgi:hypothetical protein